MFWTKWHGTLILTSLLVYITVGEDCRAGGFQVPPSDVFWYLKSVGYCLNHRKENLFKRLLDTYYSLRLTLIGLTL